MRRLSISRRVLALGGVLAILLGLFVWVALRAGPLTPVRVTAATVERHELSPGLFGIGIVEARYTNRIGPTAAGRLARIDVQVGEAVQAGQVLGEMDPVDLDERSRAQQAALGRAQAGVLAAEAQLQDLSARRAFAETQARRYEQLRAARSVSDEAAEARRQEWQLAEAGHAAARANLDAARQELARARADREGLARQRANLKLVAPAAGIVAVRAADPGTTVVAGQAVVEIIDPSTLWLNVRFDQLRTSGLRAGLPARIALRSRAGESMRGKVARVEPVADAVTEEALAKIAFDPISQPPPALGELAQVTIALPARPAVPVVHNASIQRSNGQAGVWVIDDGALRFAPVRLGASDLDGHIEVPEGLKEGERIVVYSERALDARTRIEIVDQLAGARR